MKQMKVLYSNNTGVLEQIYLYDSINKTENDIDLFINLFDKSGKLRYSINTKNIIHIEYFYEGESVPLEISND